MIERIDRSRSPECAPSPAVGSHVGLRISNFAPRKPSNVRICLVDILTFDGFASSLELQAGLSRIGVRTLFAPLRIVSSRTALRVSGLVIVCESQKGWTERDRQCRNGGMVDPALGSIS